MDIESLICSHVRELKPYEPPDLEAVATRAGLRVDQLIRLDANENPFGPSPRVAQALAEYSVYQYYPDYRALRQAVARYAGVAPQQVVLGNGADELIDLVIRLFLEPGQGVIICPPAFSMYQFCAELGRHPVLAVPRGDDFAVDVEGIEALVREHKGEGRPRLLFLTSPGNPDGQIIPLDVVRRLLTLPLAVVVDEAYIEFGGETAVPLLAEHENLVVIRTFSKWAGMAGLRLGYALTAPEVAACLDRVRAPYNVNAAAMVAALATFDDLERVRANVARLVVERERLQTGLAAIPWLEPIPSQANFVLCRVRGRSGRDDASACPSDRRARDSLLEATQATDERADASQVAEALVGQGILVRGFCEPRLEDYVRISVGRPEQNEVLLEALRELWEGS